MTYSFIYVDNLILTDNNHKFLLHVVTTFASKFSVNDLDDLSYFLGVEVLCSSTICSFVQRKYISMISWLSTTCLILSLFRHLQYQVSNSLYKLAQVMLMLPQITKLLEDFNIFYSLVLTLSLQSTNFLDSCMFFLRHISVKLDVSFGYSSLFH